MENVCLSGVLSGRNGARTGPMRRLAVAALSVWLVSAFAGTAGAVPWPTYHLDSNRTGNDTTEPALTPPRRLWTSPTLDGAVYAEPLIVGTSVFVATENDSIYALAAEDGHVIWRTHVGTPVDQATLPCGNINPLGITGTPVVDLATGELFAVAEEAGPSGPVHELVGVDTGSGAIRMRRFVDPQGADPSVHQQRAALALGSGNVYVAYGGLAGDCGNYNGRVVGSKEDGSGPLLSYKVPTAREGGSWAPAGPTVDATGNLFVATGNGSATAAGSAYDHGNSVIKLSPALAELDSWAPTDWLSANQTDADVGSTSPEPVGNGLLFQVG